MLKDAVPQQPSRKTTKTSNRVHETSASCFVVHFPLMLMPMTISAPHTSVLARDRSVLAARSSLLILQRSRQELNRGTSEMASKKALTAARHPCPVVVVLVLFFLLAFLPLLGPADGSAGIVEHYSMTASCFIRQSACPKQKRKPS